MIAKVESGTTQYFLSDRLSTRLVLDASGNVIGRMAHLPFGEDFGESGTQEKHHFTSYERDAESGSDYAINRQYSQAVGRFLRVDPYDGSSDFGNPQSLNRYAYVANDPVNAGDPLGLFQFCMWRRADVPGGLQWTCFNIYTDPQRPREPGSGKGGDRPCSQESIRNAFEYLNTALEDPAQSPILGQLQAIAGVIFTMSGPLGGADGEAGIALFDRLTDHATAIFGSRHTGSDIPQDLIDETNNLSEDLNTWLNKVKGRTRPRYVSLLEEFSKTIS